MKTRTNNKKSLGKNLAITPTMALDTYFCRQQASRKDSNIKIDNIKILHYLNFDICVCSRVFLNVNQI